MITAEIKINKKPIYRIEGVRYPGTPAKGTNPYQVKVYDEHDNLVGEVLTVHEYEDGPVKLVQRMAQAICNSINIKAK